MGITRNYRRSPATATRPIPESAKPVLVPNPLAHPGQYAAIEPNGLTTRDGTDHRGPVIRITGHHAGAIMAQCRNLGWWFGFRESDGRGHSHYRITDDRFDK